MVTLFFLSVGNANAQFPSISVELLETGQPSVWSVEVFGRGVEYVNMVTADGTVLEPQPWGGIRHTETFRDHESALAFLHGDWTTTEVLGRNSAPLDRQFTILPFTIDELNRSFPVVSSPTPDFEAKNGEPFLLAWDFESANGEADPDRSVVIRRRSIPEELGFSRAIVSKQAAGSGWSQSGGPDFNTRLEPAGDGTTFQRDVTATSNEPLPQAFEIQVGSYFELDEFLVSPLIDETNPDSRPITEFSYTRRADAINLALGGTEIAPTCIVPSSGVVGDFDGNGAVEFADFLTIFSNFGQRVTTYDQGDANCSGFVLFDDFLVLSENYGQATAAPVAVPEPDASTTQSMILFGAMILAFNWRKSRRHCVKQ